MFTKLALDCVNMARDEECGDKNLQVNFPAGKDGDGDNVA